MAVAMEEDARPRSEPVAAPTAGAPEPERVRAMFDAIAGRYDLLNRLISLNQDASWRRRAAARAVAGFERPRVLDLCAGTGDLALAVLRARPGARVVAVDFSANMLALARRKAPRLPLARVDALALPFAAGAFDAVTVAFGVRNLADRARGLAEMRRVLAPAGRLVVLEAVPPPRGVIGALSRIHVTQVLPRIGRAVAGGARAGEAYRYFANSVEAFASAEALRAEVAAAGFAPAELESLGCGAVALVTGVNP